MAKEPKIAVVIPFVALNDFVFECIHYCLALEYSDFNLVLLPDDKIELPLKFIDNSIIKIIETGDCTISRKRNLGIKAFMDADYYAFIDSDAFPRRDWLKNAVLVFRRSDDIWGIGGPSLCPSVEIFRRRIASNALKSLAVSGLNAKYFRESTKKDMLCNDLPTCNLIIRREAVERIGGFKENYITGEDKEFCSRMIKNKMRIAFCKDIVVYHHSRAIFLAFLKQRIVYGLSVFKIARDNFNFSNLSLFIPFVFVTLFILLLTRSFLYNQAVSSFWIAIIVSYFSIMLIEALRWSSQLIEIPLTFITLIAGNLTPGFGTLLAIFNPKINIKKIYKNYE